MDDNRLITGARDGVLNIWNYNNGHCLRKLQKSKGNDEICDVVYVEMNKNRYIISVGWDKRINIYSDSQTDSNITPMFPTDISYSFLKNGHKEDILSIAQCQPNLLATAGYDGEIVVWNMTSTEGALISTMTINEANTMLCVADNLGFVFVYNVDGYALSGYEEESPELVNTWRGHVDSISCIE
ncbi:WD repeat-containing protein 49-like [Mytilus trossulus]|uniref:WD repeat-containing protein 49-like n=1 Tax=Mytilus trossulus TaxID=6551 RepID=UPI00300632ED